MKIAAFAVAAIVLSRVLECAPAPISVVDSTGLGLQITTSQVLGTYTSTTSADGKQQLERRARKVEVNSADGSGCMHRQWTCGSCSGISNETLMMVNEGKCYKPTGSSSYDCDGQRISVGLVAAVQNGHCVETCSLRPKPLHCSEPAPTGSPTAHSRQLLAAAVLSNCESPSWQCQLNATQASIAPEVYDLVRSAPQNCTALSNTMLCGSYLLDMGLFDAIRAGACQLGCTSSAPPGCSVPPAPAVKPYAAFKAVLPALQPALAPATVPAPAPAPACPPQPQPGCSRAEHVCGAQGQYRISDAQFNALNAAHSCAADLDVSFCIVGRFVVEALVFDAVKGGNCTRECLEGVSLATCPAAAAPDLAPAPAPGFDLYGAPAPVVAASSNRLAQLSTLSASTAQGGSGSMYELLMGPLGECSVTCGGGQAQRSLSCIDAILGLPVEMSKCQLDASALHNLTQPCNTQPCGSCHWEAGEWSTCSAACGTGAATRSVQCISGGQAVAVDSAQCAGGCAAAAAPAAFRSCAAAAPCVAIMWQTGPWSACQGGGATRSVACVDASGRSTDSQECTRLLGAAPEAARTCGVSGCSADAACMNGGTCNTTSAVCACRTGFAGPTCSISLGPCAGGNNSSALTGPLNASTPLCCPTGVVDKQGACCSSGVVSDGGACCAAPIKGTATLDRSGQCCSSGRLDACGMCSGNATAVDFTGACCAGSLDAGGRCCPAPAVTDEFGVCGGDSSSGLVVLNLGTLTNDTQGLSDSSSPGYAAFSQGLLSDLSTRLGVNTSQISLKAVSTPGAAARRLLSSEVTPVIDGVIQNSATGHPSRILYNPDLAFMSVLGAAGSQHLAHAFTHLAHGRALAQYSSAAAAAEATVWVVPPYGSLTYAQLLQLLGNSSAADAAVRLTGVSSFSKSGLAGNGLCELGELPSADSAGVPADCPLGYHAVPSGFNGTACSGRGLPVAAQGACQCFVGYEGPACGGCADGYWPAGGLCQRTLGSFQAAAALAGRNSLLIPAAAPAPAPAAAAKDEAASLAAPLIASLLGAFLVLSLVAVVWVIVSRRRKRRAAEPAEKAPAVEGSKGSLQDPEKGHNAATSSQVAGTLGPQSHAISLVSDSSTPHAASPTETARGSFFGLFGRQSQQPPMQPTASPVSDSSSSGSVSSLTSASRRRSHAMGSITFASPADSRSAPINTSRRGTFSYVHDTEQGTVSSHPLRGSSSPRSLHSADSQTPFPTQSFRQSGSFRSDTSDKGKAPMQPRDIVSHHVTITDSSELSSAVSSPIGSTRPASFISDSDAHQS